MSVRSLPRPLALAVLAAVLLFGPAPRARAEDDLAPKLRAALVRLHVTSQTYEREAPWKLGREYTRTSRGVVVQPGVILTKASNVAHQTMIEISIANSARRYPARLKHQDRDMGLALVEFDDKHLLDILHPLPLGDPVKLDDEFEIFQLGDDNIPERYDARVIRAQASSDGLDLQLKTTCSDGGDGQVALKDGKIVGLLVSTYGSRQQGTMTSIETIRQYLGGMKGEKYRGRPGPGFWTHQLLRQDLRTFYGLAPDQHGIAVSRVLPGRTGDGVLQAGDVILSLAGFDLDDEGRYVDPVHGRLSASYLLGGRNYAGDTVKAHILRKGKEQDVEFELKGEAPSEKRVPDGYGNDRPQFMVVGGLVLLELTSGSRIARSPGGVLLRRFRERSNWDPPGKRRRMIYVDRVLQDKSNKGFEYLSYRPVRTINGIEINDFASVPRALQTPEGKYHVFRFDGVESDFVIPADQLDTINKRIAGKYKVTRLRYLRGDPE
jgi:S1-C subfamily serine protease